MVNDTVLLVANQIGDHARNVFLTEQKKHGENSGLGRNVENQLDGAVLECKHSNAVLTDIGWGLDDIAKCESTSSGLDTAVDLLLVRDEYESVDEKEALSADIGDSFPLLEFPVTINIEDITPTISSNMSYQSMQCSVKSSIERNKSLCSVPGGKNLLTVEEEERVSQLLLESDEDVEKFGCMSSTEEERETELDNLLLGLGYDIKNGVDDNVDIEERREDDSVKTSNGPMGDPVLRELAKSRALDEHERSINQALHALLSEPLPPVIRFPEDGIREGEDGVSLLTSFCSESMLTSATTEEDIQHLIQKVKKELEDDELELADHQSIRLLARSIFDDESSKKPGHVSMLRL
mmetsp:Transcript_23981/g.50204  ORF Transcript_23981/g.50204 Transcript_23981/m.50204 type:complete len:351 (+) Transcript_23981:88-1140(+)